MYYKSDINSENPPKLLKSLKTMKEVTLEENTSKTNILQMVSHVDSDHRLLSLESVRLLIARARV